MGDDGKVMEDEEKGNGKIGDYGKVMEGNGRGRKGR